MRDEPPLRRDPRRGLHPQAFVGCSANPRSRWKARLRSFVRESSRKLRARQATSAGGVLPPLPRCREDQALPSDKLWWTVIHQSSHAFLPVFAWREHDDCGFFFGEGGQHVTLEGALIEALGLPDAEGRSICQLLRPGTGAILEFR